MEWQIERSKHFITGLIQGNQNNIFESISAIKFSTQIRDQTRKNSIKQEQNRRQRRNKNRDTHL